MNVLLMVFLIAIPYGAHIIDRQSYDVSVLNGETRVIDRQRLTYSDRYTIEHGSSRYHVLESRDAFTVGDVLYVQGVVKRYASQTIPFGFDARRFYRGQGIDGYVETSRIEHIGHRTSFWHLRSKIQENLVDHPYVRAYILGEKTFENETDDTFRSLGLSFLLTMSGLHVYALIDLLKGLFFRFDLSKHVQDAMVAMTLLVFLYVQAGSMSMIRITLSFFMVWLNRKYDLGYTRLDRLFIVFYVMIVLNTHYVFHDGFIMTFLILLSFALMENTYRKHEGYMRKLMLSTIVLLVTLPFYPRFLPLVAVLMPVFILLFTKPLFYGAIIVMLVPDALVVYDRVIDVTERVLSIFEDRQVVIELPAPGIMGTVIYYVFLYLFFRSKRRIVCFRRLLFLLSVFVFAAFQHRYVHDYTVYFLDVRQGDATVFVSPDCVLLIDSFQYTTSFLNSLGIRKIDYVMLTHADQDHVKEAPDIIERFSVDHVILSPYETYDIHHEHIERPRKRTRYSCGVFDFDILGPLEDFKNGNDNSLIIRVSVYGKTYLFTGDAGIEAEQALIDVYGKGLKSDVLQIGHHGSDTSTSRFFLSYVEPEVGIISLGPNRHGFPHQSVLESLLVHEVAIMRTDEAGTIFYSKRKNTEKWGGHIPNGG